jgi:hypothetical protein
VVSHPGTNVISVPASVHPVFVLLFFFISLLFFLFLFPLESHRFIQIHNHSYSKNLSRIRATRFTITYSQIQAGHNHTDSASHIIIQQECIKNSCKNRNHNHTINKMHLGHLPPPSHQAMPAAPALGLRRRPRGFPLAALAPGRWRPCAPACRPLAPAPLASRRPLSARSASRALQRRRRILRWGSGRDRREGMNEKRWAVIFLSVLVEKLAGDERSTFVPG